MTGTLVSVIIPTFNRADLVVRAVESVLAQTHANVEAVVVDDGSTDGTCDAMQRLCKEDARVVYCKNKLEKGCGGARNTGIAESSGEYIAFLDDDDEYLPEKVAAQLDAFARFGDADVVVAGAREQVCSDSAEYAWLAEEFLPNKVFLSYYVMCRRAVLDAVRFRVNYMEWRDFAFQAYMAGLKVHVTGERLVRAGDTGGSLSKQRLRMYMSALSNAREYYRRTKGKAEHAIFRRYLALCHKNIANVACKQGNLPKAVVSLLRAFCVERRIRNLIPFT